MRVFDESKAAELAYYDLEKGYLKDDKLFIAHHEAVEAVEGVCHYETIKEYPNGGKEVEKVWDVLPVEALAAYDEYEDIQVYVQYTEKELAEREISSLKAKLAATDYKAIKYAEGAMSESEYAETKSQRQAWRDRINDLETKQKEASE